MIKQERKAPDVLMFEGVELKPGQVLFCHSRQLARFTFGKEYCVMSVDPELGRFCLSDDAREPCQLSTDRLITGTFRRRSVIRTKADEQGTPEAAPTAPLPVTKASLLAEASATVAGRGKSYGTPEDNFRRIVDLQNVYIRHKTALHGPGLTPLDNAVLNILTKIGRLIETPGHHDSWVDIAGYAACGGEIAGAQSQGAAD